MFSSGGTADSAIDTLKFLTGKIYTMVVNVKHESKSPGGLGQVVEK
jgi:hypothetical protein